MNKQLSCYIATAMTFLIISWGHAQNLNWINIHGLASQGYMKSSDNNYFMNTKDGSVEFNEAAINFTVQLTPQIRGGIQIFSRDFGATGNNEMYLDWGYLDYQWKDYLGFRAGKIKRPMGFYNTGRDVDALRTSVLLPQGVYDESMRDFTLSVQGASLYGNVSLDLVGDLEYEGYYGICNMNPNMAYTKDLFINIANNVGGDVSQRLAAKGSMPPGSILSAQILNPMIEMEHSEGLSLVWNTPLSGLRLGATRMIGKTNQSAQFNFHVLMEGTTITQITIPFESSLKFKAMDTYSGEFIWNNLSLSGEYTVTDGEITSDGKIINTMKKEAYYGQAAYRFFNWLEAGSYYCVQYPNSEDKKGNALKAMGQPDYMAWQKDICLSLRFDLNDYWLFKFETHFMDGAGQLSPSLNPDGFQQNWQLYTIKTSIIF